MFTGIIEELGKVADLKVLPDSAQLTLEGTKVLEGTQLGDSIAVNGICLTVVKMQGNLFTVDVMAETLHKTNLKQCSRGTRVNLERALQLSTRLGGHLVSGHVDGVGTIQKITPVGIARVFTLKAAPELLNYVLPKGSIAIDGISLTVVDLLPQAFTVSLIPHTRQETTLGFKDVGDMVNLETDLIGKYVARFMEKKEAPPKDLSMSFLAENGFI
ncbi:riboflavin synthase subunit alpha [Desulfitobacterium hafniense]|uniref:Riboflavin synthase n=1 Tax=Desulfitobacterium hafniense TaxID=49338 RepID=A0A0W1JHZ0_DESHA|nr:riboflavin synthase [Desulfitobacterium hafniense]KTE91090.1 riboflavin synthase subunit alpha [Desulfitobacterium hafniense]